MSKSLIGTLAGLAVLALVSQSLEGTVRTGAWAGYVFGAGLGCVVIGLQASVFRRTPRKALEALILGFLVKLVVLAGMCIAVRFVDVLGSRMDWRAFTLAATTGIFLLLMFGTWDNAPILREGARLASQSGDAVLGSQNSSTDSSSAHLTQGRTAS
ncbi:MAG: hypothetical protein GY930_21430 [bacterium]|nr:hypothetical protein [bacterium]